MTNQPTKNSECNQTEIISIYTCSKCHQANSSDPARCCSGGDFHGEKRDFTIPLVSGRYYTDYFSTIENDYQGKIIRSSEVKKYFNTFIYTHQEHLIQKLFESLKQIKPIYRDGNIHNPECEFACGDLCDCWCAEKYHGLKGVVIPQ